MRPCCKRHVTSMTVLSPTDCSTCGSTLVVRGRRWVYHVLVLESVVKW